MGGVAESAILHFATGAELPGFSGFMVNGKGLKEGQDGRLQTEKRRCSLVGPVADEATKARKGFCANVAQDETTHDG
ncbi:hypothetical protein Vadar_005527 [Vaccinium darrowii]|uniref:Uncharacterized protein n=1 Tax=Vaccinium darrowii TaxID=229202 RepID=A0ACB7YU68_9ERIC|nr:hypothetical protein Vadar_005527 [Vaccinium darrowii]